jgi:hypothetical protein
VDFKSIYLKAMQERAPGLYRDLMKRHQLLEYAQEKSRGGAQLAEGAPGTRAEGQERPPTGRPGGETRRGEGAGAAGVRAGAITGQNFKIEPGKVQEGRGWAQKARDNLEAIELAKQLKAENRLATRDEQNILAKYVGWGGLSGAFRDSARNFRKGLEDIGERRDLGAEG